MKNFKNYNKSWINFYLKLAKFQDKSQLNVKPTTECLIKYYLIKFRKIFIQLIQTLKEPIHTKFEMPPKEPRKRPSKKHNWLSSHGLATYDVLYSIVGLEYSDTPTNDKNTVLTLCLVFTVHR